MTFRRRKQKPLKATTEAKRRARIRLGTPPPEITHLPEKLKPPKHKKQLAENEAVLEQP
jgi:hypothetical protein